MRAQAPLVGGAQGLDSGMQVGWRGQQIGSNILISLVLLKCQAIGLGRRREEEEGGEEGERRKSSWLFFSNSTSQAQ